MEKKCLLDATNTSVWLRKKMKIIKLLGLYILIGTLQVSAAAYSQTNTASIKVRNAKLVKVLNEIRQETGYSFVYSAELIDEDAKISLEVEDMPISDILEILFEDQDLNCKIVDDVVVISQAAKQDSQGLRTITGKVMINGTNEPLPGANVVVKDGLRGTVTDVDGNFSITIPADKKHLLVTFIGFITKEVEITNQQTINIFLAESVSEINQVVVTGMQKREKSKMIGSVSSIDSEKMDFIGAVTVDEAMKGQMAGLYVRSDGGNPGQVGEIQIRGINTMTGSTQPLFVLDGMPMQTGEISGSVNEMMTHGLGNIPPEDIESITILRDATAASVYGSRAANGVVVITTKQGKAGKDYISYSGKFGVNMKPQNQWSFMNTDQKIGYEQSIFDEFLPTEGGRIVQINNHVRNGNMTQAEADAEIARLRGINTDWMDVLYRNAFTQSHNVTMSGGNDRLQYHVSANYNGSQGTLMENDFETGGINMKLNRFVNENLLVKVNLYSTLKKNKQGLLPNSMDPYQYAVYANPYERPYDDNGDYVADASYLNIAHDLSNQVNNPYTDFNMVRELRENTQTDVIGQVRAQLGIEYTFLSDFRYNGSAVIDYNTSHSMQEVSPGTYTSYNNHWLNNVSQGSGILPEYNLGQMAENFGRRTNYTVRNSIEYNKNMNRHYVQAFAANEFSSSDNYQFGSMLPVYLVDYRLGGYPNLGADVSEDMLKYLNLYSLGSTSFGQTRSVSFIGSAVYSFDNRYVANFNVRYDGIDILGSANNFQPLWSAGVKWNAHNESFLAGGNVFDNLVLSFGYGYRGSINRTALPFHTYRVGTIMYDGEATLAQITYGNPALRWEQKRDLNLGLEVSTLKGRVNLQANYFDERITDLLDRRVLPASVGRTDAYVNVGALTNKGLEVSGRFEVIKQKDFMWELGANVTTIRNHLDNAFETHLPNNATFRTWNIQGQALNSWYGYKFSHIDSETGNTMVYAQRKHEEEVKGQVKTTYTKELIDLENISDQELQENYATYNLGQRTPQFYGGFNTRFVYKGFDINANFVFAGGNKLLGFNDYQNAPNALNLNNDLTVARTNRTIDNLYRWTQHGDVTDVAGHSRERTNAGRSLIDNNLENGAYLKLNSLSVGWRANPKVAAKTPFNTLSVRLIASNLFTITDFSGADPETQNAFGYPITPMYTLSLNFGF